MQSQIACSQAIGGGEAIGASGQSKVYTGSLGGKLLRVRELSGRARRRGEDAFVRSARPWLRKLLASALVGRSVAENKGEELDRDELTAAGLRGLADAMASWDPEKCPSFTYWAKWRVVFAVAQACRGSLVVAGARPRLFDGLGEDGDEGGFDAADEAATPEQALIDAEEAAEEKRQAGALRLALSSLPERWRSVLLGARASKREREAATAALRAELVRLGVAA